MDTGRS